MDRYMDTFPDQDRLRPNRFRRQTSCAFEFVLNELIDNAVGMTVFHSSYKNDDIGAPAPTTPIDSPVQQLSCFRSRSGNF